MSQVREALNPGLLEGDLLVESSSAAAGSRPHVQPGEEEFSADEQPNVVHRQRSRSGNADRGGRESQGGKDVAGEEDEEEGNHDSDPPIENQNPEDGDSAFEESKQFVDEESGEGGNENNSRKKPGQFHQRKRKNSVRNSDGSYIPPYKKNRFRRQVSVLPSKFLLGGNIRDPLNLASLADAKVNAEVNKVTPQSSPLPVPPHRQGPIPVVIPKNPDDPLGLAVPSDNPHDFIAGVRKGKNKKRHRRRHGRKRTDSECSAASTCAETTGDDDEAGPTNQDQGGRGKRIIQHKARNSELETSFETSEDEGKSKDDRPHRKNSPEQLEKKVAPASTSSSSSKGREKSQEKVIKTSRVEPAICNPEKKEKIVKDDGGGRGGGRGDATKAKENGAAPRNGNKGSNGGSEADSQGQRQNEGNNEPGGETYQQTENYPCKSSEYVPLSSSYAPSPYIFDPTNPEEVFEVKPFESPSLTNYCCNAATPSHLMEPFSPPPRPEIPHFQRRMQSLSSVHHRHPEMSLQRAVFQKPFHRRRFRHKSDPIVSPVIPQPGCSHRRNHHHHHHNHRHGHGKKNDKQGNNLNSSNTSTSTNHSSNSKKAKHANNKDDEIKTFRPKDEIYQFGNYKQYYGYRTTPDGEDTRLWILKKDWFRGKDVLDIGCNIGHVTLSIARDFEARRVHGIDIDNNLITAARKNIKHYMIHDPSDKSVVFPHSLPMIYGALQPPSGVRMTPQQFPFNVMFSQENYVLNNDALLETVKPEYDVIICLSVTKWIHLNFGDDGIKRFFQRMYRHLRKGGKLILEPQEWNSYYRKRKLTARISEHYKNIKLMPDQFQDFLIKEIGFDFVQKVGAPHHSKGFQRPILIFSKESKGDSPPTSEENASTTANSNNA